MISVIVPVYKVEPYLNRCVASIVQQTFRDLEIILVDDGSPDQCGNLCEEWAQRDNRIQVIHQKNAGLSAARNAGLDRATGEYLAFLDSDDYIEPDMLEHLLNAITDARAELSVCNFVYEFESKEMRESVWEKLPKNYQFQERQILSGPEYLHLMRNDLYTVCEVAWNKLYRRECFENVRYPIGRYHEDEFVICPLVYPMKRIVCIPVVGYHYLQRSMSIMGSGGKHEDMLDMLIERCLYLTEKNEQKLALTNEGRLLVAVKRAVREYKRKQLRMQKKAYFAIIWEMYQKKWISFATLCKRFILCKVL